MAYSSLFPVALKAFVVLVSAQVALGTPASGILVDEEIPQIPVVNPPNKFTSVPVVANLITLNRYESWCVGFLGWHHDPVDLKTDVVKLCSTVTVNDIKTIRSGTSTATFTVSKIKIFDPAITITKTKTATTTTTLTTTQTTTPTFAPPPPAFRRRESDTAIPEFLNGCDRALISSACSILLHSLSRGPTATATPASTSTNCSKTETAYTATITIPRKITASTTTTTATLNFPVIPATITTISTIVTTLTSTSSIVFTACPAPTRLPSLYAVGYDEGKFKDLPATSMEDCCLACYNPSRSINCNAWLWWGEGDRCTVAIGTSPNEGASAMCPKGFGDAVFGQDESPVNIGVGGSGPCGRNISVF